jgi:hypothetical protein
MKLKHADAARRQFLDNPELRLIDIPDAIAASTGVRVSKAEIGAAVKRARAAFQEIEDAEEAAKVDPAPCIVR